MSDLFDGTAHQSPQETIAAPKGPSRRWKFPVRPHEVAIVLLAIGAVIWGAWVTKAIADPPESPEFVQLQLQGIIGEYLQAQARSGKDESQSARETAQFMAVLDREVAELGNSGKVVLVHEAIIGGDVPDVTASIKQRVYGEVSLPTVGAPPANVSAEMQSFLQEQAPQAPGGGDGAR